MRVILLNRKYHKQIYKINQQNITIFLQYFITILYKFQKNIMLSINDLNSILKIYGYEVQQRIQQLNQPHYTFGVTQFNDDSKQYELSIIAGKYHRYQTTDQKEMKYVRRLAERVLEIFRFLKMKSNNQNLLSIIQKKISDQLEKLTKKYPLPLGQVFSFLRLVAKKGCIIKLPAQRRRGFSKSSIKYPSRQNKSTRIYPAFSANNFQKRATTTVSGSRHFKANSVIIQKKVEEIAQNVYQGLDLDKMHIMKWKENFEDSLYKDIVKRNQKINVEVKKYEKLFGNKVKTEAKEDPKLSNILIDLKNVNTIKGIWLNKKRKPVFHQKRNISFKENISII